MNVPLALLSAAVAAAAVPATASAQATLAVDPAKPCYREQETVSVFGAGFTPNGEVEFTRDGRFLGDPLVADPSGAFVGELTLPNLRSASRSLTYDGTDLANPAIFASTTLLVTAIDVVVRPLRGAPERLRRITARGFTTGPTLYAHAKRAGGGRARNVRIGSVEGPCGVLSARKRLFPASARPGRYRVQFDTFRRYASREVEVSYSVTIERPPKPKPKPRPNPPQPPPTNCQGYSPCIPPGPDVDCAGGSGDGPRFRAGPIYVTGSDPYGLDSDGDGVACES